MTNIIVDSIRLRNFGAVKDATFRPLHEGLTGIAGVSGAGKTTFLKGMRFALFNELPKNVNKANLRRVGSDYKTDECSVSVVFLHNGQTIEVIRELVGKASTNIPTIYVDGKEEVHTSSGTAEAWVKKRLGMDAKDFTTATVIPQKQLDEIVDAVPSIRRARIEKLAGIESMSTAVKNAREEENAVKTQANAMPGSLLVVDELEEEVDELNRTLKEGLKVTADITAYLISLNQEFDETRKHHDSLVFKNNAYKAQAEKVHTLENRISSIMENRALLASQLEAAMARFQDGNDTDTASLEASLRENNEIIARLDAQVRDYKFSVKSLQDQIEQGKRQKSEKNASMQNISTRIADLEANSRPVSDEQIAEAEKSVEDIQDRISGATAKKNQLIADWKETAESVKLLSNNSHDAECPTCHSHLDDPSGLIASLERSMERIKEEGNNLNSVVDDLSKELVSARTVVADLRTAQKTYASNASTIEHQKSILETLGRELEEVNVHLAEKEQALEDTDLFDIDAVHENLDAASEAKDAILRRLEAVKHVEQARKEKEALEAKLKVIDASVQDLQNELSEATDKLSGLEVVDPDELESLRAMLSSTEVILNTKNRELQDQEIANSTNRVRLEGARKNLDKEKVMVDAKADLLAELEHKAAVSDVLDEFRKSSIAKIAPELADSATELIRDMTDGKFVEVLMDSEFTPSVINSEGHTLTIHQLSGGELSVVALALRIAIGSLISGGTGGMLWLDEVLSAQDINRRHAILKAIRSLPVNQIVMINHTQEAEDIVDKVVRMTYSAENGSYIDEEENAEVED